MAYTKEQLLGLNKDGSTKAPGKSVHGPGLDGGPKKGLLTDHGGLLSHPHAVPNIARGIEHQDGIDRNAHSAAEAAKGNRTNFGPIDPRMGGKPKLALTPPIHAGMQTQTKAGGAALGADHKSLVDALTGDVRVPGAIKSAPGWGSGDVRTGHPLMKAPQSKNLKPVATTPGMKSRTSDHRVGNIVGQMLLDAAFDASSPDDARAHGRNWNSK